MNLENTKIYTTNPEVIRKYSELCGKKFECEITSSIGVYNCDTYKKINGFMMGSPVDIDSDFKQLTTDQINALYDEKFGKVETPEEAEVFESMAQDNESVEMQAMIDYENSVQSQIHRVGDMLHNITCSMHDNEELQQELGLIVNKLWSVKIKTPQQREERERLEAINEMYMVCAPHSLKPVRDSDSWVDCARLYDANYRKQKDGE